MPSSPSAWLILLLVRLPRDARLRPANSKASLLIYFLDLALQTHVFHILPYYSWNGRPSVRPLNF